MDVISCSLSDEVLGEEGFDIIGEFAQILLAKPAIAHGETIALEDFGADTRALCGRNFDALPVRAALVWNTAEAKISRNDDMSNVLCLPSDYISPRVAEHIAEAWLDTSYSTDIRHIRRIKEISKLDK